MAILIRESSSSGGNSFIVSIFQSEDITPPLSVEGRQRRVTEILRRYCSLRCRDTGALNAASVVHILLHRLLPFSYKQQRYVRFYGHSLKFPAAVRSAGRLPFYSADAESG